MPSARFAAAGRVGNGKLYVVGGTRRFGQHLSTTLVYDAATNRWTTASPLPSRRTRLGLAFVGSFFYAVGGKVTTDLAKIERYTP